MRKKVFVGLSGGVDSAVSAALLQREGYEVVGVFIYIRLAQFPCPAAQDRVEAMRVAAHLGIAFQEIDLSQAYEERVYAHMLQECNRGRTPNPDALCNREIKFGLLYEYAMAHGADYIATGHYARTSEGKLFKGVDPEKDQSYFLWMVPEARLRNTIFPVGDKHKSEIRALAKRYRLPNALRKDSQGLCFLGALSLPEVLQRELQPAPGDVLNESGVVIGRHEGVALYTLGQRHGISLFAHAAHTKPQYIIAKDIRANTIVVSESPLPRGAQTTRLRLIEPNWIGEVADGKYTAQYRYHQTFLDAQLTRHEGVTEVTLLQAQYVPEGQSLVLYDDERCLGGGVIDTALVC